MKHSFKIKSFFSLSLLITLLMNLLAGGLLITGLSMTVPAEARQRYYHGRSYYQDNRGRLIDSKTGSILKGGLVGAGIGAGAGLLTGRSVGRTALVGGGVGAGVQATRNSRYLRNHPVTRTAAYGALTGAGASTVLGDGRGLGKGALWGAGIGAGVGLLKGH
jgi:hypothetical protein